MKEKTEINTPSSQNDIDKYEEKALAALADEAYEEYVKGGKKSRPIEELWDEENI